MHFVDPIQRLATRTIKLEEIPRIIQPNFLTSSFIHNVPGFLLRNCHNYLLIRSGSVNNERLSNFIQLVTVTDRSMQVENPKPSEEARIFASKNGLKF